jgi:hypothetical protein
VLAALAESGHADETAVLFFSDHGEAFLEHPPIRRHSYGLYEEELRVPLLLRVPGVAPRRVEEFVRTVDLLPTLLELFGLDDPDAGLREGISLVPELLGRARVAPRPPQLAEIRLKDGYHADALVRAPYKLYHDVSNDRVRLYDLAEDPAELRDLASERPELAAELRAELDAARAAAAAKGARFEPGARVEHTPEEPCRPGPKVWTTASAGRSPIPLWRTISSLRPSPSASTSRPCGWLSSPPLWSWTLFSWLSCGLPLSSPFASVSQIALTSCEARFAD